jgi:hypothetical protein
MKTKSIKKGKYDNYVYLLTLLVSVGLYSIISSTEVPTQLELSSYIVDQTTTYAVTEDEIIPLPKQKPEPPMIGYLAEAINDTNALKTKQVELSDSDKYIIKRIISKF